MIFNFIKSFLNKLNSLKKENSGDGFLNIRNMILFVAGLVTFAILFSCSCNSYGKTFLPFIYIALAYFMGGIVIGFIFGVPKISKDNSKVISGNAIYYNDNTNLEEISDWITKIIIGISLTQFDEISRRVTNEANKISNLLFFCTCSKTNVIGFAIIYFYFACGLIVGYLWSRIRLPTILTQSTIDQQTKISLLTVSNRKIFNNLPGGTEITAFLNEVTFLSNSKPIIVEDDLQKNRWGGMSAVGDYTLSTKVNKNTFHLYDLQIKVRSTNKNENTLVGFLLHDSFPKEIVIVEMKDGTASLSLTAYEAFTIAAVVKTELSLVELELDLNTLNNLPDGFKY